LQQVKEGTKILLEGGGRQTARVLEDNFYNSFAKHLGAEGAQFITETKSLSSKNLMPFIKGRMSYFITEALSENNTPERLAEIEAELQKLPFWGKAIKRVGDKFESSVRYDPQQQTYTYDGGKDIFDGMTEDEIKSLLRSAFIEDNDNSELSKFGKALLGNKKYE